MIAHGITVNDDNIEYTSSEHNLMMLAEQEKQQIYHSLWLEYYKEIYPPDEEQKVQNNALVTGDITAASAMVVYREQCKQRAYGEVFSVE